MIPIPAITECKYSKFKLAHDMMMQAYNIEQNDTQIMDRAKRVMYLKRPLKEQHELIEHLCQASYVGVHMIIKKNIDILQQRLEVNQRYKRRAGRTDKQPTVQDLLDTNWIAKLGELSNQSIKLHKLLFKTCIEARLLMITTTTSKVTATSKDQRRAWPTKLMRRVPFPFSRTYFTDTEDANEQGIEELLFRDLWHQQSITWLATDAALLACTHQQIAIQYNDICRLRSLSLDEAITKMSGDTSAEIYWNILPEPAQTMLRRNYNAILYMGIWYALEEAKEEQQDIIDEVLVSLNREEMNLSIVDNINTTIKISEKAMATLQNRFAVSKIISHQWAQEQELWHTTQPDDNQQTYYDELVQITINNTTQPEDVRTTTNYGRQHPGEPQTQITPFRAKEHTQYGSTVSTTQKAEPIYLAQITDAKMAPNIGSKVRDTVYTTNQHLATNDLNDLIQGTELRHNELITRNITKDSHHGPNSLEYESGTTLGNLHGKKRVTIAETAINNSTGYSRDRTIV